VTSVRPATPHDANALVDLAESVGREEGRWILGTGPWRSASVERRSLRSIQRYPDAAVFVAEDGERLVGRLSLSRDPHPASRHVADLGLMVAASHRRQGVGTALLDVAVGWAPESGVRKLELHVFPWNEPARALYGAFCYERECYRKRHFELGDELVDAILMAYFLEVASDG
jgi:RimJ/RimL family protein N-acetyltransferase